MVDILLVILVILVLTGKIALSLGYLMNVLLFVLIIVIAVRLLQGAAGSSGNFHP